MSTHSRAWTPGRIASVSVLAIAVGALVVDKAFLGHGEPASAAAELLVAPSEPGNDSQSVMTQQSLAHRLEGHRGEATVAAGEAFIAPPGFFPVPVVAAPVASDQVASNAASAVQLTWPHLSAVVTGSTPGAILDGRLLRIGESAGAVELVSVAERSVTVRQDGHEAVLTLDESTR